MSAVADRPHRLNHTSAGDIFNYDAGLEEAARSTRADENNAANSADLSTWTASKALDMDEEVVVTKKRQPIAKLDETRILSAAGIPRLRKISKQIKFKGKGNEFSDMAKLLHTYQLWLDDLYPRAKFADGLSIIEKLGHKKTMQMYRKGWIDEGKPTSTIIDDSERLGDEAPQAEGEVQGGHGDAPEEDELDALMAEVQAPEGPQVHAPRHQPPDEDELDALLAEAEAETSLQPRPSGNDDFADDEEAMAGMDW